MFSVSPMECQSSENPMLFLELRVRQGYELLPQRIGTSEVLLQYLERVLHKQ
jgi:hypothetical protein